MRKILLFIFLLMSTSWLFGQGISGDWAGTLNIQTMQLRLVFHITETDTLLSATMDSPDQGASGIPMSNITFENDVLAIEMNAANIEYLGTLKMDTIFGIFKQRGQEFPLNLSRTTAEKVEIKRPQEPVEPYPYYSEEVTFVNKDENITLAGTLTLPTKEGKFPVVVLITGSGPQNRNEELMGHKPFLVLADYLTRNGIGVLRYDDRGTYASKGNFSSATTNDFATDVVAAVSYLRTRKEIDKKNIGLIGHSEGGIIAPIVAANDKEIKFIVLMASTAIPGGDLLLLQQELIGRGMGIDEKRLIQTADINSGIFKIISNTKDSTILKKELSNYLKTRIKEINDIPKNVNKDNLIDQQIAQITTPWMLNFIRYNPAIILEKVKCPVLAINGSKDLQVPANVNLSAIENALKKGGNKKFRIKELPGMNHLFQECQTGLLTEYSQIEQTFSPVALETIASWINETIK